MFACLEGINCGECPVSGCSKGKSCFCASDDRKQEVIIYPENTEEAKKSSRINESIGAITRASWTSNCQAKIQSPEMKVLRDGGKENIFFPRKEKQPIKVNFITNSKPEIGQRLNTQTLLMNEDDEQLRLKLQELKREENSLRFEQQQLLHHQNQQLIHLKTISQQLKRQSLQRKTELSQLNCLIQQKKAQKM